MGGRALAEQGHPITQTRGRQKGSEQQAGGKMHCPPRRQGNHLRGGGGRREGAQHGVSIWRTGNTQQKLPGGHIFGKRLILMAVYFSLEHSAASAKVPDQGELARKRSPCSPVVTSAL